LPKKQGLWLIKRRPAEAGSFPTKFIGFFALSHEFKLMAQFLCSKPTKVGFVILALSFALG